MEDGTVSIFGLVCGVAATTSSSAAALAGAVRHNPEALKDLLLALQASPG